MSVQPKPGVTSPKSIRTNSLSRRVSGDILREGDWQPAEVSPVAVTQQVCIRCGESKPAEGNFKHSGQSATGYIRLCDACRAAEQAAVTDLTCARCGQTKAAVGNFYRNSQAATGFRGTCIACVKAEERAYQAQAAA